MGSIILEAPPHHDSLERENAALRDISPLASKVPNAVLVARWDERFGCVADLIAEDGTVLAPRICRQARIEGIAAAIAARLPGHTTYKPQPDGREDTAEARDRMDRAEARNLERLWRAWRRDVIRRTIRRTAVPAPAAATQPVARARETHRRSTAASRSANRSSNGSEPPPPADAPAGFLVEINRSSGAWRPLNGKRWRDSLVTAARPTRAGLVFDLVPRKIEPKPAPMPEPVMRLCEGGCGRELPASTTKPHRYCSHACGERARRARTRRAAA